MISSAILGNLGLGNESLVAAWLHATLVFFRITDLWLLCDYRPVHMELPSTFMISFSSLFENVFLKNNIISSCWSKLWQRQLLVRLLSFFQ
jgi:hypothetical protein